MRTSFSFYLSLVVHHKLDNFTWKTVRAWPPDATVHHFGGISQIDCSILNDRCAPQRWQLLISFLKIADSTDTNGIVNTIFGVTRSSSSVAAGLKNDDTNLSQVEGLVNLTRKQLADDENLDHTTSYLSFWDCDVGLATIFDFLRNPMYLVGFERLLRQNKRNVSHTWIRRLL